MFYIGQNEIKIKFTKKLLVYTRITSFIEILWSRFANETYGRRPDWIFALRKARARRVSKEKIAKQ